MVSEVDSGHLEQNYHKEKFICILPPHILSWLQHPQTFQVA